MSTGNFKQTPQAKKFWESIPSNIRVKLLNNVFCGTCMGTKSLGNPEMKIEKGDLIITGACTTCGHDVCRLVEGD